MTAKIRAFRILFSPAGDRILLRYNLLSVRIEGAVVLLIRIAGVPDCKMRPGLLRDQNRQLCLHAIFPRQHKRRCVRADCALSHRQSRVMEQNILLNVSPPLRRVGKIRAAVVGHTPVLETKPQVLEPQTLQIHAAHLQQSVRSLQHRCGKNLPHRNIHIRNAILENGLMLRIGQREQLHHKIRPVSAAALHLHVIRFIQRIDEPCLHLLILMIIQRVDPDHRVKNIRIARRCVRDRRQRKIYDRETPLLRYHGFCVEHIGLRIERRRNSGLRFIV